MKSAISIIIIVFSLCACDLIVINTKKQQSVELSQNSAYGAVYLFKSELDSNNIAAAVQILVREDGKKYLASDKIDMYDDLSRLRRTINGKSITGIVADSLTLNKINLKIELDYTKTLSFSTTKIENQWYISSVNEF